MKFCFRQSLVGALHAVAHLGCSHTSYSMKSLNLARNVLTSLHIGSLLFGLYGLVILPRSPEFLANMPPEGMAIMEFGMAHGGAVYIVFGALAVGLWGAQILGMRQLLMFLVPSFLLSLASELLGTSTGFPFGAYSYTELLGPKILGLVPFVIPLSWFYMGLVSYMLARAIFGEARGVLGVVGPLLLGAWFLTAWDLVLDPAMAVADPKFWVWLETGPFFGMPLQNFAGWFGTGLLFMAVARGLWGTNPPVPTRAQLTFPLIIYVANIFFSAVMSIGAGLYIPVLMGLVLGLLPVVWAWWCGATNPEPQLTGGRAG
ncbi:glr1356 [Gloeobacter violaceus PCC 7421]|uniref:Glr1356 protein n=2 Tax=Gloeobacter violaceus TaxID=33072 RepID=Q7NKX0_GLOVI|nr:glr1356 [Gloeobacter violaceus PCC 7421]